jgi:hypothetical protein
MTSPNDRNDPQADSFSRQALLERPGFFSEYLYLLRKTGKWWLLPMIVILIGLGAMMILSSTAAAPFIYTLF